MTRAPAASTQEATGRLIDEWFPCAEVDTAVGTPAGSGLSEKALFTWFASRPIAQARAAVLTTLLADDPEARSDIKSAILTGDPASMERVKHRVATQYPQKPPVVLDVFSGRGIIPLEATRCGATAIGADLSPVATLGGRLLADYPLRDWSNSPALPYHPAENADREEYERSDAALFELTQDVAEPRLLRDVRLVLAEVQRRVSSELSDYYPRILRTMALFRGGICGPFTSPATGASAGSRSSGRSYSGTPTCGRGILDSISSSSNRVMTCELPSVKECQGSPQPSPHRRARRGSRRAVRSVIAGTNTALTLSKPRDSPETTEIN